MSAPRDLLFIRPHMAHLEDHPTIGAVADRDLALLEQLMAFCAQHGLGDPQHADLSAFAALTGMSQADLTRLSLTLRQLGADGAMLRTIGGVAARVGHRAGFTMTGLDRLPRIRRVSVAAEELPEAWRSIIAHLRATEAYSPYILDRMELRLCVFVWSARQAGCPVELGNADALRATYRDLRRRSAEKNGGEPRFAYLRSAWEEYLRFARAAGLPEETQTLLRGTFRELERRENAQSALKMAKIAVLPGASAILAQAARLLDEAEDIQVPAHRHAGRNRAAAIALGIAVPARPGDVEHHHVFGRGFLYDQDRGAWRVRYVPTKTAAEDAEPLDLPLDPYWNRWIDALILQDHSPAWIAPLRQKVIDQQRPVYVNYNGTPCVRAWYSRAWSGTFGTGGHIARTLVYDELADLGELGIQFGKVACHHRSPAIVAKYRSRAAKRKSVTAAQDTLILRGAEDDISDLL